MRTWTNIITREAYRCLRCGHVTDGPRPEDRCDTCGASTVRYGFDFAGESHRAYICDCGAEMRFGTDDEIGTQQELLSDAQFTIDQMIICDRCGLIETEGYD